MAATMAVVRILLVSQMYPSDAEPDYGVFVRALEEELGARGHTIELAVLTSRRGGKAKYARLMGRTISAARSFRPDVVYAHFLVPTGLIAAVSGRVPLVVTAHGQDVANIGSIPGVRTATSAVVRRATSVVAVSDYLRRALYAKLPAARGRTTVTDYGGDQDRLHAPTP